MRHSDNNWTVRMSRRCSSQTGNIDQPENSSLPSMGQPGNQPLEAQRAFGKGRGIAQRTGDIKCALAHWHLGPLVA